VGDLPARLALRAFSIVLFSGMTDSCITACQTLQA
jgi:hypothetical protein